MLSKKGAALVVVVIIVVLVVGLGYLIYRDNTADKKTGEVESRELSFATVHEARNYPKPFTCILNFGKDIGVATYYISDSNVRIIAEQAEENIIHQVITKDNKMYWWNDSSVSVIALPPGTEQQILDTNISSATCQEEMVSDSMFVLPQKPISVIPQE